MGKKIGFAVILMTNICRNYNLYADRKRRRGRSKVDVMHLDAIANARGINRYRINHGVNIDRHMRTCKLISKTQRSVNEELDRRKTKRRMPKLERHILKPETRKMW